MSWHSKEITYRTRWSEKVLLHEQCDVRSSGSLNLHRADLSGDEPGVAIVDFVIFPSLDGHGTFLSTTLVFETAWVNIWVWCGVNTTRKVVTRRFGICTFSNTHFRIHPKIEQHKHHKHTGTGVPVFTHRCQVTDQTQMPRSKLRTWKSKTSFLRQGFGFHVRDKCDHASLVFIERWTSRRGLSKVLGKIPRRFDPKNVPKSEASIDDMTQWGKLIHVGFSSCRSLLLDGDNEY